MVERDENSNNNDDVLTSVFMNHVNIKDIILGIWHYNLNSLVIDEIETENKPHPLYNNPLVTASIKEEVKSRTPINSPLKYTKLNTSVIVQNIESKLPQKRTREEIEQIALNQGAKGG